MTAVGRASVADSSISVVEGVEMTTSEDDKSTEDVETRDGVARSVDTLMIGFTEDSTVTEVGVALPISLARLEDVSVGSARVSGIVADSDIAAPSVDVSSIVLMSSKTVETVRGEGSSLKLESVIAGNSEDET